MIRAQWNARINKLPAEVFPFIADVRNEPKYIDGVSNVQKVTDGEIGAGTTFTADVTKLGTVTTKVDHFEPSSSIGFAATSPKFDVSAVYRLIQRGKGGTDVICDVELTPKGLFRLTAPFMKKKIQRGFAETRGPAFKKAIEPEEPKAPAGPWRRQRAS